MLFVGDDWAEHHHDVERVNGPGRRLARAGPVEGLDGLSRLHALIGAQVPEEWVDLPPEEAARRVVIGIETDRGPWEQALLAAGYLNPMQVVRYRERHSTSGAKSDAGDAHVLAEIVRLDREHHRRVAGDSPDAAAALRRANRRNIDAKAGQLQAALRTPALRQPAAVQKAALGEVVAEHLDQHRAAEVCLSQPGLGTVLSARVLAELGDDPGPVRRRHSQTAA